MNFVKKNTRQLRKWLGNFGKFYTQRNTFSLKALDSLYRKRYGVTRTSLNKEFLKGVDRTSRILEVGSNVGQQLLCLQKMGFKNLYGIEPQRYAVEKSKAKTRGINIITGNAFDLPFKDGYFDIVFTSGVLIHIHPDHIKKAMQEIARCAKNFIWGFEYYSDNYSEIEYRGSKGLLWKAPYQDIYKRNVPGLKIAKQKLVGYKENDNLDIMFLLKKCGKI